MIWPATTRVGCALASTARTDYLVCRYATAGNIDGRRCRNVQFKPIRPILSASTFDDVHHARKFGLDWSPLPNVSPLPRCAGKHEQATLV